MTTRVRIQRLVLNGVPPAQRAAVLAAFQVELARLLPGAVSRQGVSDVRANAPLPRTAPEAGRIAARAVVQAIGGRR